jgi:hypothetical protein
MRAVLAAACLFAAFFTIAAEPPPADAAQRRHLLGEYGPYANPREAYATLEKALAALTAEGGGLLVIPADAPAHFYPRNRVQAAFNAPAVTIEDSRGGIERSYVPPVGGLVSHGTGGGARIIERDVSVNLPWQGVYSTEYIATRIAGGASSYMNTLTRPVTKGERARFHVESHRGLFVGQTVRITGEARGYSGDGEWTTIAELGVDGTEPFFVADAKYDHPSEALVYNKNVVNGLTVHDVSNADNQSMTLLVDKTMYGAGDTFVVGAALRYQGNVMSAAGDEGGLCYGADIVQEPVTFRGAVESWSPATGALVYKPGATAPQTLAMSRPIINLNPAKWHTAGKVVVVPPGHKYLREEAANLNSPLLVSAGEVGWDASLIGRFIAIDEPTERYAADETLSYGYAGAPGVVMHRWWHITALEQRPDGRWNLYVERTMWWTNRRAGPSLMRWANYSTGTTQVRELAYIIAPGAWASDVRHGVTGDTPGNVGAANAGDPRRLLLAPTPQRGTAVDFAPDDPILQPLGPDPWLPTGFRVRHHQGYPGHMAGASFDAANLGKVQVGTALGVWGPGGTLEEVLAQQKDGQPSFGSAVTVFATTSTGFVLRGAVRDAAIDLWQYDGNLKPLRWLMPAGVPTARFYARPTDGAFVLEGRGLELNHQGTTLHAGISATATPARNLRGIQVPVPAGATTLDIVFVQPEADAAYSLTVQPNWFTLDRVATRTATGFTVEFQTAAPAGATLDWQLLR